LRRCARPCVSACRYTSTCRLWAWLTLHLVQVLNPPGVVDRTDVDPVSFLADRMPTSSHKRGTRLDRAAVGSIPYGKGGPPVAAPRPAGSWSQFQQAALTVIGWVQPTNGRPWRRR